MGWEAKWGVSLMVQARMDGKGDGKGLAVSCCAPTLVTRARRRIQSGFIKPPSARILQTSQVVSIIASGVFSAGVGAREAKQQRRLCR